MKWLQTNTTFRSYLYDNALLRKSYTWKQLIASGVVAGIAMFPSLVISSHIPQLSSLLLPLGLLMVLTAKADLFLIDCPLLFIPLLKGKINLIHYIKIILGVLSGNLLGISMLSGFTHMFFSFNPSSFYTNIQYSFEEVPVDWIDFILPGFMIGLASLSWFIFVNRFIRFLVLWIFMFFYTWLTLYDFNVNLCIITNLSIQDYSLTPLFQNHPYILLCLTGNTLGAILSALPAFLVRK